MPGKTGYPKMSCGVRAEKWDKLRAVSYRNNSNGAEKFAMIYAGHYNNP